MGSDLSSSLDEQFQSMKCKLGQSWKAVSLLKSLSCLVCIATGMH